MCSKKNTKICHKVWNFLLFEVNWWENTSVIGQKPSKTLKIGCFSMFHGPPDPKSKIGLRQCTRLCSPRILRGHWRKSVEKQKSLCIYKSGCPSISIYLLGSSNVYCYITTAWQRPTYRVFSPSARWLLWQWWGCFKVGRPCQALKNIVHEFAFCPQIIVACTRIQ